MIYELALVASADLGDTEIASLNELVINTLKGYEGEVLVQDDWGKRSFAQPTASGSRKGHFLYFIYRANNQANQELERKIGIDERIMKSLIVKLGELEEQEKIVKGFKSPFSKKYNGSVTDTPDADEEMMPEDLDKDRRRFARKKACWFTAKGIKADWKDPATFAWLINDFGKIAPGRVSGISRKHQRFANCAVKRARQLGVASYLTSEVMR